MPALRRHVQTRVPVRRGADEHAGVHGDEEAHDVAVAALSRRQQHHLVVVGLCSLTRRASAAISAPRGKLDQASRNVSLQLHQCR